MKIITGSAKGKKLKTLEGEATRPTSVSKYRGADASARFLPTPA